MPCDIYCRVFVDGLVLARHNLVAAVGCLVIFTVEYLWVG